MTAAADKEKVATFHSDSSWHMPHPNLDFQKERALLDEGLVVTGLV